MTRDLMFGLTDLRCVVVLSQSPEHAESYWPQSERHAFTCFYCCGPAAAAITGAGNQPVDSISDGIIDET